MSFRFQFDSIAWQHRAARLLLVGFADAHTGKHYGGADARREER